MLTSSAHGYVTLLRFERKINSLKGQKRKNWLDYCSMMVRARGGWLTRRCQLSHKIALPDNCNWLWNKNQEFEYKWSLLNLTQTKKIVSSWPNKCHVSQFSMLLIRVYWSLRWICYLIRLFKNSNSICKIIKENSLPLALSRIPKLTRLSFLELKEIASVS